MLAKSASSASYLVEELRLISERISCTVGEFRTEIASYKCHILSQLEIAAVLHAIAAKSTHSFGLMSIS